MKILLYVHSPTWFTEISLLGKYLHAARHDVLFYIVDFGHWTTEEFARQLVAEGIPFILESGASPRQPWSADRGLPVSKPSRRTKMARRVQNLLGWIIAPDAVEYGQAMRQLKNAIADARALVRLHQPDVIVMGGDNPGYTTAGLIEGAHAEGTPVVLVPSTMSNGLEEAEVFTSDPRHHVDRPSAELVAEVFPHWVRVHNGLKLLRCPPGRALAIEALGLAPPEPWAFNSGYADAITAESPAMIDYAAAAGLPRARMISTGSPSDDAMFRILRDAVDQRRRLYEDLQLPAGRPMLLTPMPPDFLYLPGGRPQCDFQTYDALSQAWIAALADQEAFNVVVALHPSVEIETMRHIEGPNVRIASRRTSELVPLCDLYVASVSSTIRWAIACGKPVINYDVYRYRYTDFMNVDGVLTTENYDEFRTSVRRLTGNRDELEALRQRQMQAAARWGFLDGRCCERILDVLTNAAGRERTI